MAWTMGRVTLLALVAGAVACGQDDRSAHQALAARVDLLERRLAAAEQALARAPADATADAPAPTLPLAWPEAATGERPEPVMNLRVDAAGVAIDGRPVADTELDAELRRRAEAGVITSVVVEAADTIPHAHIVALLDRIRASGLGKVALAVRGGARPSAPPEPEPEPTAR